MQLIERIRQDLIDRGNGDFTDIIYSIDCSNFRDLLQTAYDLGHYDGYKERKSEVFTDTEE
jgi:hypothetical protein